jgi:hypothetical protein
MMRRVVSALALAIVAATVGVGLASVSSIATAPSAAALTPSTLNISGAAGVHLQQTRFAKLDRDGALSVPLPFDRTLWIFADTTGDAFSLKGSTAFAEGNDPNRTVETLNGYGGVLALLPEATAACPIGQTTSAWPTSAVGVPQSATKTMIIIYYQANCAILGTTYALPRTMGVAVLWYDAVDPGAPPAAKVLNQSVFPLASRAGSGGVPGYGAAAVYNKDDGNVYVYACDYNAQGAETCRVGRTWAGNVATPSTYTYFNGSTWVPDPFAAVPVGIGGIISVGPNVQWVPQMNRYVSSNMPYSFSNVEIRTAPNPWGPWSTAATADIGDCHGTVCRTVALHPQLSTSSSLAVSYVPANVESPMVARLPMSIDPIGSLDSTTGQAGAIRATGWALDPDVWFSLSVAIYVDGQGIAWFPAATPRPDIERAFPGYGPNHGFDLVIPAAPGAHRLCVFGINQGLGAVNPQLGCRDVQVLAPPGAPQNVRATGGDTQALVAWDPPASTGGGSPGALTYEVAVSPAVPGTPIAVPAGALSTTVNGLTNGVAHSFTVRATSVGGTGPWSPASAPVVPAVRAGTRFHPVAPFRVIDTRTGIFGRIAAGAPRDLQLAGVAGIPSTATAVVMNVTVTESSANSFVTAYPAGQPRPGASNLNFAAGQTVANLATIPLGGGKVSFATAVGTTHLVGDVVGWYDDGAPGSGGDLYTPTTPTRILDSRTGAGWLGRLVDGSPRALPVAGTHGIPATATAVVFNLTSTQSSANTFLTAWPTGQAAPTVSNLNVAAGQTIANLTTVKLGQDGKVSFATATGSTDVIADLVGWYEPGTGSLFHPLLAPTRILDDRTGIGGYNAPITAGADRAVTASGANGVPATAVAVIANTTAVQPSTNCFVTIYPTGEAEPTASAINVGAGQIVPNLVIAKLGAGGKVNASISAGTATVLMDVSGYFSTP